MTEGDLPQDLLDLYFRDLRALRLLTAEEERWLAKRIEAGREAEQRLAEPGVRDDPELERIVEKGHEAFNRFITANLRRVASEAAKFTRRSPLGLDELIQEGNLGFIRAVEKFDWHGGLKFSTYATWWIRQALQRGAAGKERTIRIPTQIHQNLLKVRGCAVAPRVRAGPSALHRRVGRRDAAYRGQRPSGAERRLRGRVAGQAGFRRA